MAPLDDDRAARALLAGAALTGDAAVLAALAAYGPVEAVTHLADQASEWSRLRLLGDGGRPLRAYAAAAGRMAARAGARLVIPGDEEWPPAVPDLATAPGRAWPGGVLCLWARGDPPLSTVLERAVAVVGARAATPYGTHIAEQLGYDLATAGWTTVSTGAYGVDGAVLRGAMAGGGTVVAVLPGGVDRPYPAGHAALLDQVAAHGLLVSPWQPGTTPARTQFPATSQLVGTLARGTVLVEATTRSNSLRALDQALALNRPAMAVPGPLTSSMSTGPHQALRTQPRVRLVRNVADVLAELAPSAEGFH